MIYKPLRMRNIMFQIELRLRIEVYVPDNQEFPVQKVVNHSSNHVNVVPQNLGAPL